MKREENFLTRKTKGKLKEEIMKKWKTKGKKEKHGKKLKNKTKKNEEIIQEKKESPMGGPPETAPKIDFLRKSFDRKSWRNCFTRE